jgi:hypothetical protein
MATSLQSAAVIQCTRQITEVIESLRWCRSQEAEARICASEDAGGFESTGTRLSVPAPLRQAFERLRVRSGLLLQVFDAKLAPVFPEQPTPVAALLREASDEEPLKAALQGMFESGEGRVVASGDWVIGLYPVRQRRETVAVVAIGSRAPVDDQRIQDAGEMTRAALEAEVTTTARLIEEGTRARRIWAVLRFIGHLVDVQDEGDLAQAVVMAAAVWFDLDARIYTRDFRGFSLRAGPPGAKVEDHPPLLPASIVPAQRRTLWIMSSAELEALGFRGISELLLCPVPAGGDVEWLITLSGALDGEVESTFSLLGGLVGNLLEHARLKLDRQCRERWERLLLQGKDRITIQEFLEDLAKCVSADRAHVVIGSGRGEQIPAAVGEPIEGAAAPGAATAPQRESHRLVFPMEVNGAGWAVLELRATEAGFTPWKATLAGAAAATLQSWLRRFGDRHPELPGGADELHATVFGRRIFEEVERAKRFDLEVALLLVELGAGAEPPAGETVRGLLDLVRQEVRGSDLVGRLGRARIGALLVQTGEAGAARVSGRLKLRLEERAGTGPAGRVVGWAAFPSVGPSAAALLEQALRGGRSVS